MATQLALPLLWPDWFTCGDTAFPLASSCFDWQLWHWLQWWRGELVIVGGTVESMAGRGHIHTLINVSTDILLLPPFVLCEVVVEPLLLYPCVPQGRPNLLCHQKLIPSFFHPPTPKALISSYLMHLSSRLSSPPHCHTTRIRNIKGILLISGLWPSSKVLFLSLNSPVNPFAFLLFSLFSLTPHTVMLAVLSEILHRNEAGCFVPKRGHFNGNIAAGIFILVKNILWDFSSRIVFSSCIYRAFENTEKHQFQIKQRHFICSTSTVYCPWK